LLSSVNPVKSSTVQATDMLYSPTNIQQFITDKTGGSNNTTNSFTGVYNYRIDSLGTAVKLFYDHTNITYRNNLYENYLGFGTDSSTVQQIGTDGNLNDIRLDFNNRDKAKYYVEAGVKYSWTKSNFHNYTSSFNNYQYGVNEDIFAAYASVKRSWKNFNATLGLRGENTLLRGNYLDNLTNETQTINKNNFKIFPNIYLEYLLKKHSLALIADTKIQRPDYGQYNPLAIINDPYSMSVGNPTLLSASVYDYTLQYTYNKKYSISAFFTNIQNQISSIVVSNNNNISVSQPINLKYADYYGLNTGGNFDVTKWWNLSYWAQWMNTNKKGNLPDRTISVHVRNGYNASINQQFKLPKDFTLNLNAFINGNSNWGGIYQQSNTIGDMTLSAQKQFFNRKLSIVLTVNDILNIDSKLSANYQDAFYSSRFLNHYPGRSFGINISYNFDNNNKKISVNTDTEEKNRAK
jgi:hypothetical protein